MIRERVHSFSKSEPDTEMLYVDFTICPDYFVAYKERILEEYGLSKENYRENGVYYNKKFQGNADLRSIFNLITYDLNEIISRIKIRTSSKPMRSIIIDFDNTNQSEYLSITTKYSFNYGRCYSIHPKDHILQLEVLSIEIFSRMHMYIYFGCQGQFQHPNTQSKVCIYILLSST